ncbi:MAG: hypothetical protein K1X92_13510 [Bacteroidia bacterium]|nr:hypothetical protein [Bacteroidia bacterium]
MISVLFSANPSFSDTQLDFLVMIQALPEKVTEVIGVKRALYQVFSGSNQDTVEKCLGADSLELHFPAKDLLLPLMIKKTFTFSFPKNTSSFSLIPKKIMEMEALILQESAQYILRITLITDKGEIQEEFPVVFE